jgi:hypothetical protein
MGPVNTRSVLILFLANILAGPAYAATDLAAYQRCVSAVQEGATAVGNALMECEGPAKEGIPGAQYALGALLVNRAGAGDVEQGMKWLESAVAAGSPPAAFHLATVYLQKADAESVARGRQLFRSAACAGYPPARSALRESGASVESLACRPAADTDFTGDWVAELKWQKTEPIGEGGQALKLSIGGGVVRVHMKAGDAWVEVKEGKFSMSQLEQTLTISANDSGWDFDGKWIETWTIQLLRTGADSATVSFLRTVNNPHVPPRLSWRTFSTLAEGQARRTAK